MRALQLLLALGILTGVGHAAEVVSYHSYKDFKINAHPSQRVLEISAFFQSRVEKMRYAKCMITVNGKKLLPKHLLSPHKIYRTRLPSSFEVDRITETGFLRFPHIKKSGDLARFKYHPNVGYDKDRRALNNFSETVFFDISELVGKSEIQFTLRIFNNVNSRGDALVVNSMRCHEDKPKWDDYGPYIPPTWAFLDEYSWAREMAQQKLQSPKTSEKVKAQLFAQFGILQQLKGDSKTAREYYERAIALSRDIPEYPELCQRLAVLDSDKVPDKIEGDHEGNIGRWVRIFNLYQSARRGAKHKDIVEIKRFEGKFTPDGIPAEALWQDKNYPWQHLSPVKPNHPGNRDGHRFKIAYNDSHLLVVYSGPGSELARQGHYPGEDQRVWKHNCVEFFITPNANFIEYYEYNVSNINSRFDNLMKWNGRQHREFFEGAWKTGTQVKEGRLTVEYQIPWSDFGFPVAPKAGDLWVANLLRVMFEEDARGSISETYYSRGKLLWFNFHRVHDGVVLRFE